MLKGVDVLTQGILAADPAPPSINHFMFSTLAVDQNCLCCIRISMLVKTRIQLQTEKFGSIVDHKSSSTKIERSTKVLTASMAADSTYLRVAS